VRKSFLSKIPCRRQKVVVEAAWRYRLLRRRYGDISRRSLLAYRLHMGGA